MRAAVDHTDGGEPRAGVPGPVVLVVAGALMGGIVGLLIAREHRC
jgi:hypothetical protein